MKTAVIGPGSMGLLFGGKLSRNTEVILIGSNAERVRAINNDHITIKRDGQAQTYSVRAFTGGTAEGPVDLIILFTKAYITRRALEQNAQLIGENTLILTLQNGAGHEEILQEFAGHVISSYTHTDPYLAVCARITYDVPGMSSDRRKLEDGEVVFQSILFAICPAKLSSPALGFDDAEGVSELSRRWTIGAPVEGFLYPSFNDRIGDLSEVLYRSKKEISGELFAEFFNAELPYTAKMQKEAFNTLMDSLNVSVESAAVLQEDLAHLDAEDISVLEKNDVKKLAERCGIETEHFDESFDDIIGTIPLDIAAIRENAIVVVTDSATIKVPAEKSRFIKTRLIDGVSYILIPVDGAVLVNGIPAVPEELMKTFKSEGSFEADGKAADDAAVTDEDFSDDRTQEDTDVFGEDLPEDPDTGEQGQDDEDIFGEDFPEDFPAPF